MNDFNQAQVQTRKDLYMLPTFDLVMGKGQYIKSEEQKRKIAETLRGRKLSKTHRENISKSTKGKSKAKGFGVGRKLSEETKDKIRQSLVGRGNPDNRQIVTYRNMVEKSLGRKLTKDEVVHHIDRDFTNNKLSNLKVMDKTEHGRMHAIEQGFGKEITHSKVTEEQVKEIVKSGNIHAKELAKKFEVSNMTIYYIWRKYGRK